MYALRLSIQVLLRKYDTKVNVKITLVYLM